MLRSNSAPNIRFLQYAQQHPTPRYTRAGNLLHRSRLYDERATDILARARDHLSNATGRGRHHEDTSVPGAVPENCRVNRGEVLGPTTPDSRDLQVDSFSMATEIIFGCWKFMEFAGKLMLLLIFGYGGDLCTPESGLSTDRLWDLGSKRAGISKRAKRYTVDRNAAARRFGKTLPSLTRVERYRVTSLRQYLLEALYSKWGVLRCPERTKHNRQVAAEYLRMIVSTDPEFKTGGRWADIRKDSLLQAMIVVETLVFIPLQEHLDAEAVYQCLEAQSRIVTHNVLTGSTTLGWSYHYLGKEPGQSWLDWIRFKPGKVQHVIREDH